MELIYYLCLQIVAENKIYKGIDAYNTPHFQGISLTANERMAWSFADRSSYCFSENHSHARDEIPGRPPVPTNGAVLEFSVETLRKDYKLVHYVDDDCDDEEEIRVICSGISPVLPLVIGFMFNPDDLEWFLAYCDTKDCAQDYPDPESLRQNLLKLHSHPLFLDHK